MPCSFWRFLILQFKTFQFSPFVQMKAALFFFFSLFLFPSQNCFERHKIMVTYRVLSLYGDFAWNLSLWRAGTASSGLIDDRTGTGGWFELSVEGFHWFDVTFSHTLFDLYPFSFWSRIYIYFSSECLALSVLCVDKIADAILAFSEPVIVAYLLTNLCYGLLFRNYLFHLLYSPADVS